MYSPPKARTDPDQKTIFVVNDAEELVALFRELLEAEGYRVGVSTDGVKAHAQIKEVGPDLVILDLVLMDVPKLHVLQMMRLDPATACLPTLICSGALPELRAIERRLREQGCEILQKPFNIDELLEMIRLLIGEEPSAIAASAIATNTPPPAE